MTCNHNTTLFASSATVSNSYATIKIRRGIIQGERTATSFLEIGGSRSGSPGDFAGKLLVTFARCIANLDRIRSRPTEGESA